MNIKPRRAFKDHYCKQCVNEIKNKGLGCDVELGGIKDAAIVVKYGTTIAVVGGIVYFLHKWGSFKFFKDFGKNVKTIAKAPKEFTIAEGDVIDNSIYQTDKAIGMLKDKIGASAEFKGYEKEWSVLKPKAIKAKTQRVGFFKFYKGGTSQKEQMAEEVNRFKGKIIKKLRQLNVAISNVGCIPCLPLLFF